MLLLRLSAIQDFPSTVRMRGSFEQLYLEQLVLDYTRYSLPWSFRSKALAEGFIYFC